MSIAMDERRVENVLGDRLSTLQILRGNGRWRATWRAALGAHAPYWGLLDATGVDLPELMREIVAADAESMVRNASEAGDAAEQLEQRGRLTGARCAKPCSDCPNGHHHWLDEYVHAEGQHQGAPYYACKHCAAVTAVCGGCTGPVFPLKAGDTVLAAMCDECRTEGLGEELSS